MTNRQQREAEGLGMIALVAALLLPGVFWISRGRTAATVAGRIAVVTVVVVAAATLEGSIDSSAEALVDAVQGSAS